jgi:hypothetical protein
LDLVRWNEWVESLQARLLDITPGTLRAQLRKLKTILDAGLTQDCVFDTCNARKWETVGELHWFKEELAALKKPTEQSKTQFQPAARVTPDFNDRERYKST